MVKNPPASVSTPGWGRFPGGGYGKPTPVFLPGESNDQRNLVGYCPRCREELNTTKQLSNNNSVAWRPPPIFRVACVWTWQASSAVSQPGHYWHFEMYDFLLGAVLGIAGGLTASLASTLLYPRLYQHSPVGTPENISTHCPGSPQNHSALVQLLVVAVGPKPPQRDDAQHH